MKNVNNRRKYYVLWFKYVLTNDDIYLMLNPVEKNDHIRVFRITIKYVQSNVLRTYSI